MKFESLTHVLHYASGMNIDVLVYKNKVVDVTEFKQKHPGGMSSLDKFIGKDCTEAFEGVTSHKTKSAIKDLNFYSIGEIEVDKENKIIQEEPVYDDVIDIKKGILWQIFINGIKKQDYLDFIHDPKHMINPPHAIMFDTAFLEFFSKTPWYMIPIVYIPIMLYFLSLAFMTFDVTTVIFWYLVGVLGWTFTEYFLHRFIFHMDEALPDFRGFFLFHFLMHGIHHAFPMDR